MGDAKIYDPWTAQYRAPKTDDEKALVAAHEAMLAPPKPATEPPPAVVVADGPNGAEAVDLPPPPKGR